MSADKEVEIGFLTQLDALQCTARERQRQLVEYKNDNAAKGARLVAMQSTLASLKAQSAAMALQEHYSETAELDVATKVAAAAAANTKMRQLIAARRVLLDQQVKRAQAL